MQAITTYKRINLKKFRRATIKLRALDHKLRQSMLSYLRERGPTTVDDIKAAYKLSNASLHLGILRRAGFVNTERSGKNIFYSINEEELSRVNDILSRFYIL